jgi:KipI family sensor histidine kinase inhibitor
MTERRTLLNCGEHAVLVEVGGLDDVQALTHAIRKAVDAGVSGFREVVDIVPAAATVLVIVDDDAPTTPVGQALAALPVTTSSKPPSTEDVIEIPVRYDGPDLAHVASLTGLSVPEIIAAHTGSEWRVAFCGFAPGFAYLGWGDPRLRVPRRREPRTSVPAGSIGLADQFTAVYPRSSPGGWQLIGHTETVVFDIAREPPALLEPGVAVRFVEWSGGSDGP